MSNNMLFSKNMRLYLSNGEEMVYCLANIDSIKFEDKELDTSGMAFINAKGESFKMGDDSFQTVEHIVSFTYNFWIDTTEVTQENYVKIMQETYKKFKAPVWNICNGNNFPAARFKIFM